MTGLTVDFLIDGTAGAMTTGHTPDGQLCRVDLRAGVHGSELAGLADALATAITLGLQHGAPPAAYVDALLRLKLDPPTGLDEGHPLVEVLAIED
jgi:ribonucleoside-diphosphate reductase alpha chain